VSGPSAHLSWAELECKDGTPYPQAFIDDGRVEIVAALFEAIRSLVDGPLTVLSAYRTPAHNRRIGGAPNSQHVEGRALDLRPPAGMAVADFYATIVAAPLPDLGGIGLYLTGRFVHVDVRARGPRGLLVRWNGGTQRKDDRG